MEIEIKELKNKQIKNSTSHRIFKGVILFIVAVFFYLIYSFVKIQFFSPNKKKGFNFEYNALKYKYLDIRDQNFPYLSHKNRGQLEECNLKDFYFEHVSSHKPCIIKQKSSSELAIYFEKVQDILKENLNLSFRDGTSNDKSEQIQKNYIEKNLKGLYNKIGVMEFAKILNFSQLFLRKDLERSNKKLDDIDSSKSSTDASNDSLDISDSKSNTSKENKVGIPPILTNKDYIFLQLEGKTQFIMSPITQINRLSAYREHEETNNISKFNPILSGRDLFKIYNKKDDKSSIIIMSAILEKGDILYVPAYFFLSDDFPKEKGDQLLKFEFESNSRILNTMFKVLFDDNFDLNKDVGNFMS
jgi:hypothetical protein